MHRDHLVLVESFVEQSRAHGGVHASAQQHLHTEDRAAEPGSLSLPLAFQWWLVLISLAAHQHFGLVHLLPDLAEAGLLPVLDGEVTGAACDLKQKVTQHLHASLRQVHLGVELRAVQLLLLVSDA